MKTKDLNEALTVGMSTATMIEAAVVREPTEDEDDRGVIGKLTLVVLAPIEEARKMAGLLMFRPACAFLTEDGLRIEPLAPKPEAPPSPAASAEPAAPSAT